MSDKEISRNLQYNMLSAVLEVMAGMGVKESAIRSTFEKALIKSRGFRFGSGATIQDGTYMTNGDVSADLLRIWHREGRCLNNDDAKPRPLHLAKGRTSLRSLVRGLDPEANVRTIVSFMRSNGLIRKLSDGRYLPTADAATISQADPVVGEHLARSIVRLLSTVRRNTCGKFGSAPLIERYAYVSNLNQQEAEAFAEFSKAQGLAYLQSVDDWMEQRRVPKARLSRRGGVVAGVQVVAYLGDPDDEAAGILPTSKRTKGTEGTDFPLRRSTPRGPTSLPSAHA